MEQSVFDLLSLVKAYFPFSKTISPVSYGADIIFYKDKNLDIIIQD